MRSIILDNGGKTGNRCVVGKIFFVQRGFLENRSDDELLTQYTLVYLVAFYPVAFCPGLDVMIH